MPKKTPAAKAPAKQTAAKHVADKPNAEKPRGRPAGSPNVTEVVTVAPSRCRKCLSTERTAYVNPLEREIAGVHDGQPYTHIIWRSTKCARCGQGRKDRTFENRSAGG